MNKTIDFQWEMTEENFRRMMAEEQTQDIFGAVRFGEYLVEFRCTGGGLDDQYHIPTTDVYHYGEEGIEEYALADGVPYKLLDEEFRVPKRRRLESFKQAFENLVLSHLEKAPYTELFWSCAACDTVSHEAWNPQTKEALPKQDEMRVHTDIGDIVVASKGDKSYPGVWVGLERNGKRFDIAMVEVDQDVDPDDPCEFPLLKAHIYSVYAYEDDPLYDYDADAYLIDKYLEETAN